MLILLAKHLHNTCQHSVKLSEVETGYFNQLLTCKIQLKFSSNEDTEHTVHHPDCI